MSQRGVGLNDFQFGKCIGEGSYSKVYKAVHKRTNRTFAIKVISKSQIERENKQKYVSIEKDTLSALGSHPGVVALYYTFQDFNSLYFIIDFAENGEFLSLIRRLGSLSEPLTRYYMIQLIDSLAFVHSKGIIHKDLKPENILLSHDWKLMLTDFGAAKILSKPAVGANGNQGSDTGSYSSNGTPNGPYVNKGGSFVGTAEYVSPELLKYNISDYSGDVWALGCIAYQMIVGRPPFKGNDEYDTFERIVNLQYGFPSGYFIPVVIRDLIQHLLVIKPADRYSLDDAMHHKWFADVNWNDKDAIWRRPVPRLDSYNPKIYELNYRLRHSPRRPKKLTPDQLLAIPGFYSDLGGMDGLPMSVPKGAMRIQANARKKMGQQPAGVSASIPLGLQTGNIGIAANPQIVSPIVTNIPPSEQSAPIMPMSQQYYRSRGSTSTPSSPVYDSLGGISTAGEPYKIQAACNDKEVSGSNGNSGLSYPSRYASNTHTKPSQIGMNNEGYSSPNNTYSGRNQNTQVMASSDAIKAAGSVFAAAQSSQFSSKKPLMAQSRIKKSSSDRSLKNKKHTIPKDISQKLTKDESIIKLDRIFVSRLVYKAGRYELKGKTLDDVSLNKIITENCRTLNEDIKSCILMITTLARMFIYEIPDGRKDTANYSQAAEIRLTNKNVSMYDYEFNEALKEGYLILELMDSCTLLFLSTYDQDSPSSKGASTYLEFRVGQSLTWVEALMRARKLVKESKHNVQKKIVSSNMEKFDYSHHVSAAKTRNTQSGRQTNNITEGIKHMHIKSPQKFSKDALAAAGVVVRNQHK